MVLSARVAPETVLHRIDERAGIYRLAQDTGEVGRIQIASVSAADNHNRYVLGLFRGPKFAVNVASVQARQPEVQNYCPWAFGFYAVQRVDTVPHGDNRITGRAKR